jgi:hypothetical protein
MGHTVRDSLPTATPRRRTVGVKVRQARAGLVCARGERQCDAHARSRLSVNDHGESKLMPADQIVHRRTSTAISNGRRPDAQGLIEQ